VAQEDRLQVVLRNACRRGRADQGALLPGRQAEGNRGSGGRRRQRVAHPALPFDVDAAGPDLLLESQLRSSSIERRLIAVARGSLDRSGLRSTIIDSTPCRAKATAAVSPAGPAPAIGTGTVAPAL